MFPRPVGQESQDYQPEELNRKAIAITQRVKQKLTGEHPACTYRNSLVSTSYTLHANSVYSTGQHLCIICPMSLPVY